MVTLELRNLNALPAGISLTLVIPSDFKTTSLTSVTASGGSFKASPSWTKN